MVTVRAATTEDVPAIRRIAHEGWRAAYEGFLSEAVLSHVREEWHTRATFERAAEGDDPFLVAVDDGDVVVGYASAQIDETDPGLGILATLYVDPDRWGEGVGTALLERVRGALAERGATRVEFEVFAENAVGRSFYEARGATVVGRHGGEIAGEAMPVVTYRLSVPAASG